MNYIYLVYVVDPRCYTPLSTPLLFPCYAYLPLFLFTSYRLRYLIVTPHTFLHISRLLRLLPASHVLPHHTRSASTPHTVHTPHRAPPRSPRVTYLTYYTRVYTTTCAATLHTCRYIRYPLPLPTPAYLPPYLPPHTTHFAFAHTHRSRPTTPLFRSSHRYTPRSRSHTPPPGHTPLTHALRYYSPPALLRYLPTFLRTRLVTFTPSHLLISPHSFTLVPRLHHVRIIVGWILFTLRILHLTATHLWVRSCGLHTVCGRFLDSARFSVTDSFPRLVVVPTRLHTRLFSCVQDSRYALSRSTDVRYRHVVRWLQFHTLD